MKRSIQPMYDKLLVRRHKAAEETEGGIIKPHEAIEPPAEGTVLSKGVGRILDNGSLRPIAIEVGATVMFGTYAGAPLEVPGERDLMILREDEVLAVVTNIPEGMADGSHEDIQ